jgi:hypothetical protein
MIIDQDRAETLAAYPFHIEPVPDNRPYFAQFLKEGTVRYLARKYGLARLPYFEIGFLVLFLTLVITAFISVVLIILPLMRVRLKTNGKKWIFLYFSGIGLGYMFIEITLIHRLGPYLGNTIYSAAMVMCLLLLFSGLGSLYSGRRKKSSFLVKWAPLIIVVLLLLMIPVLKYILISTAGLPLLLKITILSLFMAPPAFLMGIPFPAGISFIQNNKPSIPWAWGINSCLSVIGSTGAMIIIVRFGFHASLVFAAGAYLLTFAGLLGLLTGQSKFT